MAETIHFNDLNDAGKERAISDFLTFYVAYFKKNNLEILSSFPIDADMSDLNAWLFANHNFTSVELHDKALAQKQEILTDMLTKIDVDLNQTGMPADGSWENWYRKLYDGVSSR
ncbi:hypothetical protein [Levilactobacillus bambusae]|uniref:Uncharacterized protein n=1 Tax=Levilactobacillus bambusae TaxID=2024736 RepID=A0A2V1MY10_9LACO|nr:hypothetical protein [Levilactobacillus bambusae]PWF99878.1 hypothetical protein DCM90_07400 [Levilactobacillus bambusae]